jgi:hypothetical protein
MGLKPERRVSQCGGSSLSSHTLTRVPTALANGSDFQSFNVPADGTGLPNFKGKRRFRYVSVLWAATGASYIQLAHAY